ncbi:MAG: DNA topoisomerase [Aequorivita sp.]|nr:DNA topoisomerase [Aequorivita sp.]MAO48090.1 DNA topoisomerase [Aequorivita sp.]MBF30138.1 DNA topoisomerase [Aequorivita sp.]HAV53734.1 DNA topoisomerase [Aequorivita sp.]HBL79206.1 DNA topoisomerase [Aequorivita sp.]|tara:strand:- start:342111 stop:343103 length:993 start_codon:yes stop_codon:yes gene_type:complete
MYKRKKHGRGFTYKDEKGKTIRDKETRNWIKSLVIPPAWTNVEISEDQNADLLVTGRDDKDRKQYIYHPKYTERQNAKKFDRIIDFANQLEHMRRVTGQHLRKRKLNREKVLATMVRLLESAFFRPGSEAYSKENATYGLTTMRSKHLTINGDELIFSYNGKSGQEQEKHVVDKKLAKIVQEIDDMPGYEIFKYLDEDNNIIDVKSDDLNCYIHEVMGEEFSAKDFRTWAGTMIAAIALDELGVVEEKDQKLLDKNIKEAVNRVSETLGNTPAVARSSYIDPRVIEDYTEGRTLKYFEKEINQLLKKAENLSKEEIGVLCMLRNRLRKKG